jgi:predicted small lipoprotein YifL
MKFVVLALALLCGVLLASCGVDGPPVPPNQIVEQ